MKPIIEPPQAHLQGASLVAFERAESVFRWNWHYHPQIELTLILEGSGTRLVGDSSEAYGPGDLVLLGPELPHTWFSSPRHDADAMARAGNRAIVVQFRSEMLPGELLMLPEYAPLRALLADASQGLRFPAKAAREVEAEFGALVGMDGLPGWLALVALLGKLAGGERTRLASTGYRHRGAVRLSQRMERIVAHLEAHYREDLPVSQVAAMVGLSVGTFSRFFRKMTRRTYVGYRNGLRIREACRLLEETDIPVTEIALECGFNNLANFNRRFRSEKGMNPRHYRGLYNPNP